TCGHVGNFLIPACVVRLYTILVQVKVPCHPVPHFRRRPSMHSPVDRPQPNESLARLPRVRIISIRVAPLRGESPQGGWSHEIDEQDSVHSLVAVHTDAGIIGYGSVFTDGAL